MSAFSERHYLVSFVSVHEGMTCGLVFRKVLTCCLACWRKVLRNSLFASQSESQGRTKPEGSSTPHTFCIAHASPVKQ